MSYYPEPVPQKESEIASYLDRELRKISSELAEVTINKAMMTINHNIPGKLYDGMIITFASDILFAGSVKGLYEYIDGAWIKL
jgi:hypothetical protein